MVRAKGSSALASSRPKRSTTSLQVSKDFAAIKSSEYYTSTPKPEDETSTLTSFIKAAQEHRHIRGEDTELLNKADEAEMYIRQLMSTVESALEIPRTQPKQKHKQKPKPKPGVLRERPVNIISRDICKVQKPRITCRGTTLLICINAYRRCKAKPLDLKIAPIFAEKLA